MKVLADDNLARVSGGMNPELDGLSQSCAIATYNGLVYLIEHNSIPLPLGGQFYNNCSKSDIEIINRGGRPIWEAFIQFAQDLRVVAEGN